MPSTKSFPAITGGCVCSTTRYRLLTSPLFCYACHCPDCQKLSGGAFGLFLKIELYNIKIISPTVPAFVKAEPKPGHTEQFAQCPKCLINLWANSSMEQGICDLRVGTLDFPSLMEPDLHIFVESKLDWVRLPEGARTMERVGDVKKLWPKSSLKRLEICKMRVEEVKKRRAVALAGMKEGAKNGGEEGAEEVDEEGDKTPTALEFSKEDDEEFERKFREKEKALQDRLEKLSLKLGEEKGTEMDQPAVRLDGTDSDKA